MRLSGPPPRTIEDVSVGLALPTLETPPLTTLHLARWAAAIEGWHRINFDQAFATGHDGLPGLPVNGSFKRQLLAQYLMRVLGPDGWPAAFEVQFRRLTLAGDTLTAHGTVTAVDAAAGTVELEIGLRDGAGEETSPGTARGILPAAP